jgi:hypothetical protein
VRQGVVALGVRHLVEVVPIALGKGGDRGCDWSVGQEVVGRRHVSSMAL